MNKKRMSMLLAGLMMFSNATSAFAMSNEVHQQIQGNSLLIGNYLFELDNNANTFDLDSFITSARSIADGEDNEVYYKDGSGNWYELVEDGSMSATVSHDTITNAITVRNGIAENTDPTVLAQSDLHVSPATIVESTTTPGTFDTEVTVSIKSTNNAKFASNVGAAVDSISSASLVRTAPTGTNMQITRVDDKNIKLKLTGTASNHAPSVNTTEGSADNQKDFNENGTYGDIKFLMLPTFFTGVNTVAEGGQYVVLDVQFNDGAVEDRIIDASKAKMLTIENVDYGVLVLNEGNIDTYNFTLNGASLNPTKVNDSGSVVKFEMNRKQVAEVKLVSKTDAAKTDTINIGSGTEAFTTVIQDQDPDRVLVSGPVSYFDYFLVDYDENGVIRSTLEKTTFDTENEGVTPVDKTVPVLRLETERTPLGDNIVINVAEPNSTLSKEWMANVYEVLKDYDTSDSARVPVQFSVDSAAGKITILASSTAINDRNGHHEIVIKSNSFNEIHVNFELVEPAGDLYLSSNFNWWAHNELLFELKDFNYAVTNPIHAVYLDGEELTGDCEDYHVISNLVRLENGAIDKLTVGEHEIIIKIHGFEDYKRTFTLETAPNGAENPTYGSPDDAAEEEETAALTVDAVSAATGAIVGGSTGGSSDGSSGGGAIRANVIYDFDHISNAFILKGLGMDTPYVNKTINWWHSFTKDALIENGSTVLMDYDFYKNNVGVNGQYITFDAATAALPAVNPDPSEYMNKDYEKPAALYLNRPYSVKNMLHDSVMGETYYFNEVTATPAPSLTVNGGKVLYGDNVVIKYDGDNGDEWAEELVSVKENSAYMKFDVNTDANTITFATDKNSFLTGDNNFVFMAEGFTTSTLKVEIYKAEQADVDVKKDDDNNVIIEGLSDDFIEHLGSISLGGKVLYNDSQYGNGKGHYEITDNQLVLRSKLFGANEDQNAFDEQVTLQVNAEGYNTFVKNFTHEDLVGGTIEDKNVPAYVKLDDANKYITGETVEIEITDSGVSEYANAIDEVYLDGNKLASDKYDEVNHNLVIDGSLFTEEKNYTIKIVADKYKDKELSVMITDNTLSVPSYVTFEQDGKTVDMGEELILSFDDGQLASVSDYAKAIKTIKIGETAYDVSLTGESYDISTKVNDGQNDIIIIADKYENKTFTVTISEVVSPAKLIVAGNKVNVTEVTLDMPEVVKIDLGSYYENKYEPMITEISLEDVALLDSAYSFNEETPSRVLTINADNFSYGNTYSLKIKANGYEDAEFTVTVKEKAPDKTVPSYVEFDQDAATVDMGTDLTLNFKNGSNSDFSDYAKLIREIKINDIVYSNNVNLNTYDITSKVSEGLNTITVKAESYVDKVFTVTVLKATSPAKYLNNDGNKTDETEKDLSFPETVEISLGHYNDTFYGDAIDKILIDDVELTNSEYTIEEKSNHNMLILSKDNFDYDTDYIVTIKANGFIDAVFKVSVEAKVALLAVPDYVKVNKETVEIGETVEFPIRKLGGDSLYEESLIDVIIQPITATGAATTIKATDFLISDMFSSKLEINHNLLKLGDNKITVKTDKYEDLVTTVKLVKKEVPSFVGVWGFEEYGSIKIYESNDLTFTSDKEVWLKVDGYTSSYMNAITAVKVDGKVITGYDKEEVGYGDDTVFVIPANLFSVDSTTNIVIEATDYEEIEFNITME